MLLRKINSYLSLTTAALFLIHASFMCLLLSGVIPYRAWYHMWSALLLLLLAGHAALSMFIFFMNTEELKTVKTYWKSNIATVVQRTLAILMLFMAFIHIGNGAKLWVYQIVYIAVASGHIGLSVPRALLRTGAVKSETAYKRLQLVSIAFGIAITVWAAVSYGIYALLRS